MPREAGPLLLNKLFEDLWGVSPEIVVMCATYPALSAAWTMHVRSAVLGIRCNSCSKTMSGWGFELLRWRQMTSDHLPDAWFAAPGLAVSSRQVSVAEAVVKLASPFRCGGGCPRVPGPLGRRGGKPVVGSGLLAWASVAR